VLSATGRTCTVILTRRPTPRVTSTEGSEEDEEGEETEFQMIDGKEREGIVEWVRKHKSAFGITVVRGAQVESAGSGSGAEGEVVGKGGDSDSDSNFEESGESDGGSPSSSGSSSGPGEHDGGEESDNEGGSGEGTEGSAEPNSDDDDGDEEIVELDPKRHPLLRAAAAGAIPKMSRAAVDAAVGLVVDDLVGQGSGASRPSASLPIRDKRRVDDEESEEDELQD
jgi:hypothetical protein